MQKHRMHSLMRSCLLVCGKPNLESIKQKKKGALGLPFFSPRGKAYLRTANFWLTAVPLAVTLTV